jgi:alpha-galactosidase
MQTPDRFTDAIVTTEPGPALCFRSGLTVCEEALMAGRYVGRGWNGVGERHLDNLLLNPDSHPTPQAFWLEVDGHLVASHWAWEGVAREPVAQGLRVAVTLRHTVRPVSVRVCTLLDGTPVLARWLEVTNTGERPAALSAAFPWSGVLHTGSLLGRPFQTPADGELFSVGYMLNHRWAGEGSFEWRPLPNAAYRIDGRYRRDRWRHPLFIVRNDFTGEHFIGQLAWSGGFAFEFDVNGGPFEKIEDTRLWFRAGPDAPAPQRMIAPGETVTTPVMHLGFVPGDFDAAVQAMHDHTRRSVMRPQPRGRGCWVESGIGPEVEITPAVVHHCIATAAAVGAEVFFMDAIWFTTRGNDWMNTVGDWRPGPCFPDGLAPFRDHAHRAGMLWGLWMEPERIAAGTRAAKAHPEFYKRGYDGRAATGEGFDGWIDLARPAVAQWVEAEMCRVIEEYELDFFRFDWNTGGHLGGQNLRDGAVENAHWRYYEALYGILERVRARYPDLILENCAGGGGRTDLGMVRFFSHTWVTDWQVAPRSFSITNGMTIALPPEHVDRLLHGQANYVTADIDFQARLCLFGRPTIGGLLWPAGSAPNPLLLERVKHMVSLYKDFVRPFLPESRIYHHTPAVTGRDAAGFGVLELAAPDRSRAVAGIFRLADVKAEPVYVLRFRGLDIGRRYRLTSDNQGSGTEVEGRELVTTGIPVTLHGPLTSELLLCDACPAP